MDELQQKIDKAKAFDVLKRRGTLRCILAVLEEHLSDTDKGEDYISQLKKDIEILKKAGVEEEKHDR